MIAHTAYRLLLNSKGSMLISNQVMTLGYTIVGILRMSAMASCLLCSDFGSDQF